jgi:hypothetical protein
MRLSDVRRASQRCICNSADIIDILAPKVRYVSTSRRDDMYLCLKLLVYEALNC